MCLLACLLLSLGFAGVARAGEPLTAMSLNIRGDFEEGVPTDRPTGWLSTDGDHRRDLVLRFVREADPDVLGVQEAYRNQMDEIDAALAGHDVYGVGREDGVAGGEHCSIYYRTERFTLVDSGAFWLSLTPDEPSIYPNAACHRVASWVVLSDRSHDRAELLVLNTHWDHVSEAARRHAAGMIRDRLPALTGDRAAIVMGDLNTEEDGVAVATLREGLVALTDAYRAVHPRIESDERTGHGFKGGIEGKRIDFVFCNEKLRPIAAEIHRDAYDGVYPSDHYAVSAVLTHVAE